MAKQPAFFNVTTPLGPDKVLLENFTGTDGLSRLFSYRLDLLADAKQPVSFDKLLGQSVTVEFSTAAKKAQFSGIVQRLTQGGIVRGFGVDYLRYHADVVPKLWLLTRKVQSRIFIELSAPDIIKKVLAESSITAEWKLGGTYAKREYCVQYQESDFAFVSRLLEEEGIYYFFKHAGSDHTLVLADAPDKYPVLGTVPFRTEQAGRSVADAIYAWQKSQEIRAAKFSLRDHHMGKTGNTFDGTHPVLATVSVGQVSHKLTSAFNLELYEYPGGFTHHYDPINAAGSGQAMAGLDNEPAGVARLRMEEETTPAVAAGGKGTLPGLCAGHAFTLQDAMQLPTNNGDYVIVDAEHQANAGDSYQTGGEAHLDYTCTINCMPKALPFRPARTTPRPIVHGTQTATVVGGTNQNILTDKFGRVKVLFHWDKKKQNSCWVRVATLWSDQNWGSQFIPRGGQEVVVAFHEGDPDKPIVVGTVYNDKNMPPFSLPDNATQSGIKTYCDGQDKYNLIRFEDKKDKEEIWVRAQKDYKREVLNNEETIVGVKDKAKDGNQKITVLKDRTLEVSEGNETHTVKRGNLTLEVSEGNETHSVKKGDRTLTVNKNDKLTVETGNRTVEVSQGNDELTVKSGNQTIKISAGTQTVEAATSITLKVGGCSIEIASAGITIKAPTITIEGSGQTTVKGGGMLQLQGGMVKIN